MTEINTTISKAEYLKRYLSGGASNENDKKKKKRKRTAGGTGLKIIDADAHVPSSKEKNSSDDDEKPQIELHSKNSLEEARMMGKFSTATFKPVDTVVAKPRRQRHDSHSSSESTETRPAAAASSSKRARHDSPAVDSDPSPPRRPQRSPTGSSSSGSSSSDSDSDLSVPRRPPASNKAKLREVDKVDIDSDASPPRRQRKEEQDSSPPRRRQKRSSPSPPRRGRRHSSRDKTGDRPVRHISPPRKIDVKLEPTDKRSTTCDGKSAGLRTAAEVREELQKRRAEEDKAFEKDADSLGRDAPTIFRDKQTGKRVNLAEEKAKKAEQERLQKELEEKYSKWNKGVRQLEMRERRLNEMVETANEPLARHHGNERYEEHMKARELKDDPMLEYVRKKIEKKKGGPELSVPILHNFAVYPRYTGAAPAPNRYALWPGYRWDGVDRSNGFEDKLMRARNIRQMDVDESMKQHTATLMT